MDADKKRIWVRGQYVEVTDEVYAAYMRGDRKMRYFENDLKSERFVLGEEGQVVQIIPSREDSLDRLVDENAQQFSDEQESVESVVLHKLEVDRLHTALSLLAPEERALIQALFFEEKTERQYVIFHDYDEENMEIGWILKRDVWGKGYASILTKMLIAECRKLRKGAIIECDPRQAVTEHIAKKHGFKFSGKRDGCDVYKLEE